MKLTQTQIDIAVKWWAGVLVNPKYDNGDDSSQGGMAVMLALLNKGSPTDLQLKIFKDELAKILAADGAMLSCDYGPCAELATAMDIAAIPSANAPWKTCMWFDDGKVTVRYGYGAGEVELHA